MRSIPPAVTFDLWHTLVFLEPEEEETYMRRQVEVAVGALAALEPGGGAAPAGIAELRSAFETEYAAAVAASADGRSTTPAEQFARAARAAGRTPRTGPYLEALALLVRETRLRVGPETLGALEELRADGYALGVVSNTLGEPGRFLRPQLRDLGLDRFIESYTFSDELPWTKPAPEIFRTAIARLGSDPSATVHVGDGWPDLEGGRRTGLVGTVLFTGLQRYGRRYRELFQARNVPGPPAELSAERLADAVSIVRRLLPPPRK